MGRIYRVVFNGTITAAGGDTDLLLIKPADDKPCKLAGWILGQSSEVGDTQEESVRITVRHMAATVTDGTGGSAPTPAITKRGDGVAGFTARVNDTGVATTSGASVIREELAWNLRGSPWERYIPDEQRIDAIQGEAIVVRLESTLADDITGCLTFFVEEEG